MSQTMLTVIGSVGVLATALAAAFWFWASLLRVPDDIDTFIAALQQISYISAWGAFFASIAAVCLAIDWLAKLIGSS
jgi:hypothetical protein